MKCGVEITVAEFSPSYQRATLMQATSAAVGFISSIAAWLAGAGFRWLVGGIVLGAVIPFTLIVILPTNKQLLSPARQTIRPNGAAARTVGHVACRQKHTQSGALAIPLPCSVHQVHVTGHPSIGVDWSDADQRSPSFGSMSRTIPLGKRG